MAKGLPQWRARVAPQRLGSIAPGAIAAMGHLRILLGHHSVPARAAAEMLRAHAEKVGNLFPAVSVLAQVEHDGAELRRLLRRELRRPPAHAAAPCRMTEIGRAHV